jgi:hypothetical protein
MRTDQTGSGFNLLRTLLKTGTICGAGRAVAAIIRGITMSLAAPSGYQRRADADKAVPDGWGLNQLLQRALDSGMTRWQSHRYH